MRKQPLAQSIVAAIVLSGYAFTAHATDWLQFGFDEAHTSFNVAETGYATATGNTTLISGISIKTAGASPTSKSVDSAPILATGINVGGVSKDILYIVATDGTILAVDAATGGTIWSNTPASTGGSPTTGSPAVDAAKQFVYAYALDGKVHKYNVATGAPVTSGGWPAVSTLKPIWEKGAAGLSIVSSGGKTYLYSVTDGYIGDQHDYQGHITAIDLADATSFHVFNSECSDNTQHLDDSTNTAGANPTNCVSTQNGIWGRSGAVYDKITDRIFITTGNGPFDPTNSNHNGINWGDSILALHPDGTGTGTNGMPVDSYTPTAFAGLQGTDADLGSVSLAILVPGQIGLQASKDACVRLISLADMSQQHGPGHTGGELAAYQFFTASANNCNTGIDAGGPNEIKPQPAVWTNPADQSVWAYVDNGNGLAAYKLDNSVPSAPTLTQEWTASGGTSPVVANGILYYLRSGNVVALDAVNGPPNSGDSTSTLWKSAIGSPHWQSLIVANSKLFAVDGSSKLWVFQLDGIFRGKFD